ncbi:hypothetical protein OG339_35700 [Streptosporangium sp. NBC_01495]|uniref:hypothetical protein n=1 Tax=Streptosporangium sp. NBC_01495 TaxID=2903899 RepID=UPI002E37D153|nr:hypothetical protein [Streptosporangium sp. NBC_01495]
MADRTGGCRGSVRRPDADLGAGAEPLGLGTVHHVDTTKPVDVPALAGLITATR